MNIKKLMKLAACVGAGVLASDYVEGMASYTKMVNDAKAKDATLKGEPMGAKAYRLAVGAAVGGALGAVLGLGGGGGEKK